MPSYDFRCGEGHLFEAFSTIARRGDPHPCPDCGSPGAVTFTLSAPEALLASPANSQSRWHDVAPPDPERPGQVLESPKEAFKTGLYEPYDAQALDVVQRERTEHAKREEPRIRRESADAAWKKVQSGGYADIRDAKPKVGDE